LEESQEHPLPEDEESGFSELIRYTLPGYLLGLVLGVSFDYFGLQTSAVGQWIVRAITGEGESILEGVFSLRQRILGRAAGMAEAYGWGKLLGMTVPWWIDLGSRLVGVDVYGLEGFYIPFFYGMSDQIGANLSGLLFLRRRQESWREVLVAYLRHPVMVSGLALVLIVPTGLFIARFLGFSPTTQVLTALEAIASNLCWIPPLVGSLAERE
jgi:hypothetical protein